MKIQTEIAKLKGLHQGIVQFNKSLSTPDWIVAGDGAAGFLFLVEQRIKELQRKRLKGSTITKGYVEELS